MSTLVVPVRRLLAALALAALALAATGLAPRSVAAVSPAHASRTIGMEHEDARIIKVSITPLGSGASVPVNAYGSTDFLLRNIGVQAITVNLTMTCSSTLTNCSASPSSITLGDGEETTVTGYFRGGPSAGSGTITMKAMQGTAVVGTSGNVTVTITPPPPQVSVSAAGGTVQGTAGQPASASFTITNTGSVSAPVSLAASCSGAGLGTMCSVSPTSTTLTVGTSATVVIGFSFVQLGGDGTVTLTATNSSTGGVYGTAARAVTAPPPPPQITVENAGTIQGGAGGQGLTYFLVRNVGLVTAPLSYAASCGGAGVLASPCTFQGTPPASLAPSDYRYVTVLFQGSSLGGAGSITLVVTNSSTGGQLGSLTNTTTVSPPPPQVAVSAPGTTSTGPNQGGTVTFTVTNTGLVDAPISYAASCTGPGLVASPCAVAAGAPATLAPSASAPVSVTFQTSQAGGAGTVTLLATNSSTGSQYSSAGAAVSVTPPPPSVAVGAGLTKTINAAQLDSVYFNVANNGYVPANITYSVACSGTGLAPSPCTLSSNAPASLQPGGYTDVRVVFQGSNAGGSGTVQLTAINPNTGAQYTSGTNTINTTPPPPQLAVTGPSSATIRAGRTGTVSFTVSNTGYVTASPDYVPSCFGGGSAWTPCTASGGPASLAPGASATVVVSYQAPAAAGSGTVMLYLFNPTTGTAYTSGQTAITVTPAPVVALDAITASPFAMPASQSRTIQAVARNAGPVAVNLTFTAACSGAGLQAGICTLSPATTSLAPGQTTTVSVAVQGSAAGGPASVVVNAFETQDMSTVLATRTTAINTAAPAPVSIDVTTFRGGTTIERALCPTVAIVADVAAQCGALRITHALPATTSYGKKYTPTLAYYSDHTMGPHVLVKVALNGATPPDSVAVNTYSVDVNGNRITPAILTATFGGVNWVASDSQRFNTGYLWSDAGHPTGINRFDVEVQFKSAGGAWYPAGPVQRGKVATVQRRGAPFGNGWWLLGLEELYPSQPDTSVLWVGGDGSTRRYASVAVRGDTTVYAAPSVTRPDSLYRSNSTGWWRRALPRQVNVYFDDQGRHRQTVNRQGRATFFEYEAAGGPRGRLQTITLPGSKTYTLAYNASAITVYAPGNRTAAVNFSGTQPNAVASIRDADLSSVSFGYYPWGPDFAINGRTDRRSTPTTLSWNSYAVTLQSGSTVVGASTVTQTIVSPRGRSAYRTGAPPAGADQPDYTFDGPRTDVVDATQIWVDTLGAPRQVVDAAGRVTTVQRDGLFTGQVKSVVVPGGYEERATFDARGNLATTLAINPHDDGRDATTQYTWDPRWDALTRIVQPEGEATSLYVDPATGDRLWEEPEAGADHNRRITYNYSPSTRLMTSSKSPMSPRDSLLYDAAGNLAALRTPRGLWSYFYKDAIGRDTLVRTPIDEPQTKWLERRIFYDAADRDTLTKASGTNATGVLETQYTRKYFAADGLIDSIATWTTPDPAAIGRVRTAWRYDALGRAWSAIAADGKADTTVYDEAGNVTEQHTRRRLTIRMTYDALNRLLQRTTPAIDYADTTVDGRTFPRFPNCGANAHHLCFPAEVSTFSYDATGNLSIADNPDARVRRTYNRSGKIKLDSLYIREWSTTAFSHAYGLTVGYDRNGRRTWLKYPRQLGATFASAPGVVYDSLSYGYDPIFGQLSTARDAINNVFQITSDSAGRLDAVLFPGGNSRTYRYDEDSRLSTLQFHRTTPGWDRQVTLLYDGRDKVLTTTETGAVLCGAFANLYSPGGALTQSKRTAVCNNREDTEKWTVDPAAHLASSTDQWRTNNTGLNGDPDAEVNGSTSATNVYLPGTDRITRSTTISNSSAVSGPMGLGTGPRTSGYESLENGYDGAGNLTWTRRTLSTTRDTYDGNTGTWGRSYKDYSARAASYYDAADKLRAVDKRDDDGKLTPTAYEEYRYDALGRRILLRSRTGTACSVPATCSFQQIQRFVWDGSQIAAEIQYPGATEVSAADLERDTTSITGTDGRYWGRTLYTPGVATDKPLDVIRIGYGLLSGGTYYGTGTTYESFEPLAIAPDWDWRGESHGETYYGPSPQCHAGAGNPSNHCIWIIWPNPAAYGATGRPDLNGWFGSLLQDQRGQTGQAYRRNRYYDPEHGHFTQEDPIGLAGGLNLYGFASGDPINYSDPLGLCGPLMPVCVWILANLPEISIVGAEALTGLSVGGRLAQGGRLTGSALQQAGRAGEAAVEKGLVQEGYTILGRQITARTSVGRRVIDFLVQRPDGTMVAIEAKAGKALRNASQLLKDEKMATEGAELVGKNAPAALKDATVVIPTEVRRP